MAIPVTVVSAARTDGIGVTESANTFAIPMTPTTGSIGGIPVRIVASGGVPVIFISVAGVLWPGGVAP